MSVLKKNIFISKDPSEVFPLEEVIKKAGGQLYARRFIRFEKSSKSKSYSTDIIFFSSPRGVHYYLDEFSIASNTIIGCVGKSTLRALNEFGYRADFVGRDGKSIDEIANDFKDFADNSTVLFPGSNISLGTIASKFDKEKCVTMEVYRTLLDSVSTEVFDVYVFTSPSNVRSYLLKNKLPNDVIIIAWGNSTEKELLSRGIKCKKLGTPSLECLINLLSEI